ncbi:MAG: metalloregulator ArsR/SmtB family transcription factor [Armatimonadota bacterium]|nr:metalloregulator ArsR/SmtB family transcription factor [Armatimonadota bacterium]
MSNLEDVFKALGDPTRLRILTMLAENGELCVCRIVDALQMGQPAVSHHMAALRHAGLVLHRKDGQWIHYSLNRDALRNGPLAFIRDIAEERTTRAAARVAGRC